VKIFVSYSRSDKAEADRLATALVQEGYDVFLDRDNLRAGEGFHASIREAIKTCSLFIFLISPTSIDLNSYAMTELDLARKRWRNPSGRILPVIVKPIQQSLVPPYISGLTYVDFGGNNIATTLALVHEIAANRLKKRAAVIFGLIAAASVGVAIAFLPPFRQSLPEMCHLELQLKEQSGGSFSARVVDISYGEFTNSFVVSPQGRTSVDFGPLNRSLNEWILSVRTPESLPEGRPTLTLRGCPTSKQVYSLTKDINVAIEPR
jgi:hypothetical protein